MRRRHQAVLALITVVFGLALYVVLPNSPGFPVQVGTRDFSDLQFRQGLDLQGGLHVRFEADPAPDHTTISRTRRLIDLETHTAVFT